MRRSQMSKKERDSRSKLKPYVTYGEFLRGTLSVRERVCGKVNCKCRRGKKHMALFVTRSKHGKSEQVYIPAEKEDVVKRWVRDYRKIKELLENISGEYWKRLKRKG